MSYIQREITPIKEEDLFILLNHPNAKFDYPIHFHTDFELNMVKGTKGKRIVGDSAEEFDTLDIVLIGPNVPHRWTNNIENENHVVTIQFHDQTLNYHILAKRMFWPIKNLLDASKRGIQYFGESAQRISEKMIALCHVSGFNATLEFLSLLHELSTATQQRFLASNSFDCESIVRDSKSRRIATICEYVNNHYHEQIKLADIATLVCMSDSALSHFFKKRTKRSLIEYVNEVRIGNATKMLFETTCSISEISFRCGFNNISNFNRIFKSSKGITPSEYRTNILQILIKY